MSNKVTSFFKSEKPKHAKEPSPLKNKQTNKPFSQEVTKAPLGASSQESEEKQELLRQLELFDADPRFGPCHGISRL